MHNTNRKQTSGCPLCTSNRTVLFFTSTQKNLERDYVHCERCDLVFVPPEFHLEPESQKARYLTHNNDPDDPDYRTFLARLWDELRPRLPAGSRGLDYGAGPGPALAAMIEQDGFGASIYDPFFFPDESAFSATYDFVTCTETVEHFTSPRREFARLDGILARGGLFGLMTSILEDKDGFADWYYHRDPTHVAFYTKATFRWIAVWLSWDMEFPRKDVVVFRKP